MVGLLAFSEEWASHFVDQVQLVDAVWLDTIVFDSAYRRFVSPQYALQHWIKAATRSPTDVIVAMLVDIEPDEGMSWWNEFKETGIDVDTYLVQLGQKIGEDLLDWPQLKLVTHMGLRLNGELILSRFILNGTYIYRPPVKGLISPVFSRYFYIPAWQQMLDEVYLLPDESRSLWKTNEDQCREFLLKRGVL